MTPGSGAVGTGMPVGGAGLDPDALRCWLARWLRSPAMLRLAQLSSWEVPEGPVDLVLGELVACSVDWDFRSGAERHLMTSRPAIVRGAELDEELVAAAAAELGLAGGGTIAGDFTHTVILGGMARACRNRARFAAGLGGRVGLGDIVMLTANRPLAGAELSFVVEAGWGALADEAAAALAATMEVFGLDADPDRAEAGEIEVGAAGAGALDPAELVRRRSWSHLSWDGPPQVDVVAAPSGDPAARRARTADQLGFWSGRAQIGPGHRLLLVTTEHYVPYQQLQALRVLTVPRGCEVLTTGTPWVPEGSYRGAAYLQEIRSALLAARDLLAVL